MPLAEISQRLGFTREPQNDLSTGLWADDVRMRDDVYRAVVPWRPVKVLNRRVVWDAFDDDLRESCHDGRLIVLRDLPATMPHAIQMLVHVIGFRRGERGFHQFASRPGAHFALVLEGWTEPTITVRFRHTERYVVNPLPKWYENSPPLALRP